ncbi:hypothetical protein AVEN_59485-1 [Araneus ventricosus]|uniref:Uncharacterized protein n=1 Tax=Araneus ventricosus TaxID=182803 RepID=A0A4Y2TU99_ARAVE|nr:hypothetical protein AVEN_59485-1 [Araneus ventricosus]
MKIGDRRGLVNSRTDQSISANPDLTYSRQRSNPTNIRRTDVDCFQNSVGVSSANGWNNRVKASQLVASLRGSAAEVLQGIPSDKLADLMTIENAQPIGDSHATRIYRDWVKTRRQKPGRKQLGVSRRCGATNELAYAECPQDVERQP